MTRAAQDATYVALLRSHGLRATPARSLVLSALETLGHATPEEVFDHAAPHLPGLSLSTVYRTLESLLEQRIVAHTHLVGHSTNYMLATHAEHAHLVCRGCGSVTTLDHDVTASFLAGVRAAHGFEPDEGHLSVFGRCADCAN